MQNVLKYFSQSFQNDRKIVIRIIEFILNQGFPKCGGAQAATRGLPRIKNMLILKFVKDAEPKTDLGTTVLNQTTTFF